MEGGRAPGRARRRSGGRDGGAVFSGGAACRASCSGMAPPPPVRACSAGCVFLVGPRGVPFQRRTATHIMLQCFILHLSLWMRRVRRRGHRVGPCGSPWPDSSNAFPGMASQYFTRSSGCPLVHVSVVLGDDCSSAMHSSMVLICSGL